MKTIIKSITRSIIYYLTIYTNINNLKHLTCLITIVILEPVDLCQKFTTKCQNRSAKTTL